MDIQLKRGLLDVCVLAAIQTEESYGHKIIKDMKPYLELSESTLYTILKRLETARMLTVRTAEYGGIACGRCDPCDCRICAACGSNGCGGLGLDGSAYREL